MHLLTKARVEEIANRAGIDTFRPDYSGRFMYGATCPAITTNQMWADLAYMVEACDDVEEAGHLVRCLAMDSMGLGQVLYWPSVRE